MLAQKGAYPWSGAILRSFLSRLGPFSQIFDYSNIIFRETLYLILGLKTLTPRYWCQCFKNQIKIECLSENEIGIV
jgi:hypothetical protein